MPRLWRMTGTRGGTNPRETELPGTRQLRVADRPAMPDERGGYALQCCCCLGGNARRICAWESLCCGRAGLPYSGLASECAWFGGWMAWR